MLAFGLSVACSSSEDGSTDEGSATGGAAPTGGKSSGGSDTGGRSTGGSETGGSGSESGGTSGSHTGGTPTGGNGCQENATRVGDEACGLNARGKLGEVCTDGNWVSGESCTDPDECVDGESRNGDTECGQNGVVLESCDQGQWSETGQCNEAPECSGSATRNGTTSCGLNGRGKLEQECQGGFWVDTTTCADPDDCVDATHTTLTDTCGLNDRGDVAQTCMTGAWEGSACADPDECVDGADETATCFAGWGTMEQSCVSGAWTDGQCGLGPIYRASVSSQGIPGEDSSERPRISANGRYVAFESRAKNLVSGGGEYVLYDVFVHDLETGSTKRVSESSAGIPGNYLSQYPSISATGRYVAYRSEANNLVSGDTNSEMDIFVHDLETGSTKRVSVSSTGTQGDGDSHYPSISASGRYVAFFSTASNLVSGATNGWFDVFVHDVETGSTKQVSVDSTGTQGNSHSQWPSISADGRLVAFQSSASNLVSGDTNDAYDIFVHDLQTGVTKRVSVDSLGAQGDGGSETPGISADGRYVAFESDATNLVSGDTNGFRDIFVHELATGVTKRVSVDAEGNQGNGNCFYPDMSSDGHYVAFQSSASNLVSGEANGTGGVFVHDLTTGSTTRVSMNGAVPANFGGEHPSISGDGRSVAFGSVATNLIEGDDIIPDIYVVTKP